MSALPTKENANVLQVTPINLINAIPIFSALADNEKEALAATARVRAYRKGDIIARQGEMLPSLMIVRAGIVVRERGEDHPEQIGRLAPGDFFGEAGLLAGIGETATLRAMSHTVAMRSTNKASRPCCSTGLKWPNILRQSSRLGWPSTAATTRDNSTLVRSSLCLKQCRRFSCRIVRVRFERQ